MRTALILDLDNTLYDWKAYYTISFRAMVHALAPLLSIPEEQLTNEFRTIYEQHGTAEYPFAIQELPSVLRLNLSPDILMNTYIRIGRAAFRRTREKHLQLYPGVRETLAWARTNHILLVGLTDAPLYQAQRKLRFLRIDTYFTALYGWQGYHLPSTDSLPSNFFQDTHDSGISSSFTFPEEHKKPDITVLKSILLTYHLESSQTYVAGDSLDRDIRLANSIHIPSIWTRYGTHISSTSLTTLLQIAPWSLAAIQNEDEAAKTIVPSYTIDAFTDLRDIIGPTQPQLF